VVSVLGHLGFGGLFAINVMGTYGNIGMNPWLLYKLLSAVNSGSGGIHSSVDDL